MIRFQKLRREGRFDDFIHVIVWSSILKIGEKRFFFGDLTKRTEEQANQLANQWIVNYKKHQYGEFIT